MRDVTTLYLFVFGKLACRDNGLEGFEGNRDGGTGSLSICRHDSGR